MEAQPLPEKKDPFAALRFREFRSFIGMRFFFTFAYQMQAVVISYYVYYLTKDKLALGLINLCEAIPALAIALYGGYLSDKLEKKALLLKIFVGVFALSLLMMFITSKQMDHMLETNTRVILMYGIIGAVGLARGFFGPSAFAVLGKILPKDLYANGGTWTSSAYQSAAILGPVVGGFVYAYSSITVVYVIILAAILAALVCVIFLRRHPGKLVVGQSILNSLKEGIDFVFSSKMMLGAMSLDLFSVFFGGAVALLPVFAEEILKVGSEGLGMMRASASAGAVIATLVMIKYPPVKKPWRNLIIAVIGFALSIIGYGLSTSFYLTLFLLFCEGAFDSVSVIIRSTIMQLLTPDEMRGRVSSVNQMFIGSSNEIGGFESGLTAKLMGTVPAVVFGGSMTLAIAGLTWLKTKSLLPLSLQDIKPADKGEEQV